MDLPVQLAPLVSPVVSVRRALQAARVLLVHKSQDSQEVLALLVVRAPALLDHLAFQVAQARLALLVHKASLVHKAPLALRVHKASQALRVVSVPPASPDRSDFQVARAPLDSLVAVVLQDHRSMALTDHLDLQVLLELQDLQEARALLVHKAPLDLQDRLALLAARLWASPDRAVLLDQWVPRDLLAAEASLVQAVPLVSMDQLDSLALWAILDLVAQWEPWASQAAEGSQVAR